MTPLQLQDLLDFQLAICEADAPQDIIRHQYRNTYALNESGEIIGLNLLGNELTDVQIIWLAQLPELRYLNLSENKLSAFSIPDSLSKLTLLNLSENESLTAVQFPETKLNQLHQLHLHDCRIRQLTIPDGLTALDWLDVARNKELKAITFQGDCPKLTYLDLSGNALTKFALPVGFAKLKYLYLVDNRVEELLFSSDLPRLNTLHLRNNQLKGLPSNFLALKKLETLYLHGNPIEQFSPESIHEDERGNSLQEVRNTLLSLKEDKPIPNDEVKLVLLGNSTAGKSSLMRFLSTGIYEENSLSSTHGILNEIWEPDGEKFKVNIWDFGGQEYYHATHRLFLSKNSVTLVLFESKTNKAARILTTVNINEDGEIVEREVELEHFPYEYWLNSLRHFCGKTPKSMLVQNKMDNKGEKMVPIPLQVHQDFHIGVDEVHRISIKAAAAATPIRFKNRFVELKEQLTEVLSETRSRYPVSEKWLEIKTELRHLSGNKKWLSWEEYVEFCEGIRKDISLPVEGGRSLLDTMTAYLHDIGAVLFYPEIKELNDKVFIDPNWLVNTIYKVLDYRVMQQEGHFDLTHVANVLKDEPIETQEILGVMRHFELIFSPQNSPDRFVAPQYLPDENPDKNAFVTGEELCKDFAFTLHFQRFMPRSLMTRFISRFGSYSKYRIWKKGILLAIGDDYLFVEKIDDNSIRLKASNRESVNVSEVFWNLLELAQNHDDCLVAVDHEKWVTVPDLTNLSLNNQDIRATDGSWVAVGKFSHLLREFRSGYREKGQMVDKRRSKTHTPALIMDHVQLPPIYMSYAWAVTTEEGVDGDDIASKFYDSFSQDGFDVRRDSENIDYGDSIQKYMEELGEGQAIAVFLSEKYFKSPNCMFELLQIAKNCRWNEDEFVRKVYPIALHQMKMTEPEFLGPLFTYWDNKEEEWKKLIQNNSGSIRSDMYKKYDVVKEVKAQISDLISWLDKINRGSLPTLEESNFEDVKLAFISRFSS